MVTHVFMSHTKLDEDFCNRFDIAAARVGIRVFRSEFEEIKPPAWKTIKNKMSRSSAMFLMVGKELVKAQKTSEQDPESKDKWKYTQNWIAYEVGLACQKGIDVWVLCDSVKINFPVPYFNNYVVYGLGSKDEKRTNIGFIRSVFERYNKKQKYPIGRWDRNTDCPYVECKTEFNLHSPIKKGGSVVCPTCLRKMIFDKGWLLE